MTMVQVNKVQIILNFIYTFLNKFFLRFGFLHGYLGFQLALNHAEYSFLKYKGQALHAPPLQQPNKYPRHR